MKRIFKSKKLFALGIVFGVLCGVCMSMANAESLWPENKNNSMFSDSKAHKVGDLITILITENASSTKSAGTDAKKSSDLSFGPGVGWLFDQIPLVEMTGKDTFKGQGSTTRTSNFTARMTAKVIAIDENGNLEIEGVRNVKTNTENEEIRLTGKIRPKDINADNTILSTYVSDAKIIHSGKGPIGDRQKEGIITQIFKFLF
ncbi:MAG: flagellar basal body L-ring protein FlgH [Armatimonadota bacterium]